MELDGKRVLLSGATGGLGRAIATELADGGASLVLSSRKGDELGELASSLPGGAGRHEVVVADLAERSAASKLVRDAGDVDILVANAALPGTGRLDSFTEQEVERALRVNLEAPVLMVRELEPAFEKKGEGHVVLIASLAGKVGSPRSSIYNATKFGLRGFAFGLREDLHPYGVGVSVVSPGFVREAGMFHDADSKGPPGLGTTTPRKVARAVSKAIRRNRLEITVAPRRQRFLTEIGYRHPRLASGIQRRGGAAEIADDLAAGQSVKR
jgi:short-subunit dehydrogenase